MTICVAVKVSEGLVLAADSTAVVQGAMQAPGGQIQSGVLKTYEHARKLSHVKDYPIGTLSWGIALVGSRSVESLIKEYEYSLVSLKEEEEKLRERRMRNEAKPDERPTYDVREIAVGLRDHVCKYYLAEFSKQPEDKRPHLGALVSGYSSGQFFPEQWLIDLPREAEVTRVRPDVEGRPHFGANWFGLTDAVVRLHWGRDEQVLDTVAKRFQVPIEEVRQLLASYQYPVLFDGMPLQDAIDYAVYLVNVAIGRFRFVVGAPLCGGEIDVAVITPSAFTWIHRKAWQVRGGVQAP
jgi:hypothetical protein